MKVARLMTNARSFAQRILMKQPELRVSSSAVRIFLFLFFYFNFKFLFKSGPFSWKFSFVSTVTDPVGSLASFLFILFFVVVKLLLIS